jgi:hypothetical protein
MLMKPLAISRAPTCKGISRLANVPDRPPVSTKNTMMVPWIVTSARYMFGSSTPPGAHLSPRKKFVKAKPSPGQASCRRKIRDMITATHAMNDGSDQELLADHLVIMREDVLRDEALLVVMRVVRVAGGVC